MKKQILAISIILVIAAGLRTIVLNTRPVGFTWDEAALGYNAYSLLKTGRDEHQKVLPIILESFGDFKPGSYAYFAVPSIAVLGLNEFATRLPSAIFGCLTVLSLWLLATYLWDGKKALFVSAIAALNPWSIYFSRGAWEANLMVLLMVLATLLMLRKRYVVAAIFWGLTFWTYQGAKMLTPLLFLGNWWIWADKKQLIKKYWQPVLIIGLFLVPILWNLKAQSGRLRVFSVFSYSRSLETVQAVMNQDKSRIGSIVYYLFHSEKLDQARGIVQRYLNHYSPRFLFMEGDWTNMRHTIAYYGYFHLPEVILLILGLFFVFRRWDNSSKLLIYWLLVAALPSAFSRDLVSGVRALPMTVPMILIIGLGLHQLSKTKIVFTLYLFVIVFFLALFMDLFVKQAPNYRADEWLTFYRPAIQTINKFQSDYKKIIFTNKFGQPYIFVLFYNKIDPHEFWGSAVRSSPRGIDVGEVNSFGKWSFESFYWPATRAEKSVLVVGDQFELPEQDLHQDNLYRLGRINYPNGLQALDIVGLK